MTSKLSIRHLVIQTARDAYFGVLLTVINRYKKLGNFIKRLKDKRMVTQGQEVYVEDSYVLK